MGVPTRKSLGLIALVGTIQLVGCGGDGGSGSNDDGSATGTGGAHASGGMTGTSGTGGTVGGGGSGGAGVATGGAAATGGATGTSTGGRTASGGAGTAGTSGSGGRAGTGGTIGTGGAAGVGGASGAGGGTAAVRLSGRFDNTDATRPSFSWSGSAMVARFQGTSAALRIDGSPNQFTVVVDGTVAAQVLKVVSGTSQYTVASGLSATAVHDLVVWKRTEGNQGANRFLGLDVTGGQLMAAPMAPDRRIEIYGDSITAGYGMDGVGPSCPYTPDTENHYLTYGALTARALNAELHAVAWSGIGMYRNYNVMGASADAMPAVYARTLASEAASAWDFASWQPHVVVINLGTNDASTKGDPGTPYETAYLGFVRMLRQKYATAHMVLTIGPMLDGANLMAIKTHLQKVISTRAAEGDTKMSFLEFPVQQAADGYGCDYHPSPATNVKMAALLTAEIKARLPW